MSTSTKNKKVKSELGLMKISDKKNFQPESLDQHLCNSGSPCKSSKGHVFIKQCKQVILQQTDNICRQILKKNCLPGKRSYQYF